MNGRVLLGSLTPGSGFLIPTLGRRGTLLALTLSSARVAYQGQPTEETFITRWGERVTIHRSGAEEASISLATEVVALETSGSTP